MSGETDYPGLDYGLGKTNIDNETGIRYGVISMNALNEWAIEAFEADYGDPACPQCGNEVMDYSELEDDTEYCNPFGHSGCDYVCKECKLILGSDEVYGDEPCGWVLDDGDYKAFLDSQNDVMLLKSPYFTRAQYCSPCVPGAGHLENPCNFGPKTYCFPPSWFGKEGVPYRGYSVKTGKLLWIAGDVKDPNDETQTSGGEATGEDQPQQEAD